MMRLLGAYQVKELRGFACPKRSTKHGMKTGVPVYLCREESPARLGLRDDDS